VSNGFSNYHENRVLLNNLKFLLLAQDLITKVIILLTNDDGIYSPALAAMQRQLTKLGEVNIVAPATEQSGVGHSITYLTPLIVKEVCNGSEHWGWAVEGSPADCVKLGVREFCPRRPDLIVSGINTGLNVGINVLYSGTVAAAIEGAFFGITSIAVSLEYDEHAPFDKAAQVARGVIEQILEKKSKDPQLFNLNMPIAAFDRAPEVQVVPMDVTQYGEKFEKRKDPWGREYYWLTGKRPELTEHETDLTATSQGKLSLTPLDFNMTRQSVISEMERWKFELNDLGTPEKTIPANRQNMRASRRSSTKTP